MVIEKENFRLYLDEDKKDTFTVRLSEKEKEWFKKAKRAIEQPKNSTALKQLAMIGYTFVAQDPKYAKTIRIVLGNRRKNERIGITESDYKHKEI